MRRIFLALVTVCLIGIPGAGPPAATAETLPLPDWIAFSRTDPTGTHIFKMRSDGSEFAQLTFGAARDSRPAWAVDGERIVFTRSALGEHDLYVMDADGANVELLVGNASDATWKWDGTRLAFVRTRGDNDDIWVADADGRNRVRLTTNRADDDQPAWDHPTIAFVSDRSGWPHVYTVGDDGDELTQLTFGPRRDASPSWGGGGIGFVRRMGGSADLWNVAPWTGVVRRLRATPKDEIRQTIGALQIVFARRLASGDTRLERANLTYSVDSTTLTSHPGVRDVDPAQVPVLAWTLVWDAQAQADLLAALDAAQTIAADHGGDFSTADPIHLAAAEPGLCFVTVGASWSHEEDCVGGTSGGASISVSASTGEWAAARMSESGRCYWIDHDATSGTTYENAGGLCTGTGALEAADASW